jgi:hypothetical protein
MAICINGAAGPPAPRAPGACSAEAWAETLCHSDHDGIELSAIGIGHSIRLAILLLLLRRVRYESMQVILGFWAMRCLLALHDVASDPTGCPSGIAGL